MKQWVVVLLGGALVVGAALYWMKPAPMEATDRADDTRAVDAPASAPESGDAVLSQPPEIEPAPGPSQVNDASTLRARMVAEDAPWPDALRAELVALPPADLLDLLDDDDVLVNDDARSMVEQIYGLCGAALATLVAEADGAMVRDDPGRARQLESTWCRALAQRDGAAAVRDQLSELLEITQTIDTGGTPRRQRARDEAAQARGEGSARLMALVAEGDALAAAFAVIELWTLREREFLEDWSFLERLSPTQRGQVFDAMFTTLDCRALGDCRLSNLIVHGLCLMPGFQCAGQSNLEGMLYQSFSPNQLEAYSRLMDAIWRLRLR